MIHKCTVPLVGLLVIVCGCQVSSPQEPESRYLEAAIRAAQWLYATSSDGEGADLADELSGEVVSPNLGSGPAGRAVFFAELFVATGDSTFRSSAISTARTALSIIDRNDTNYGLYGGLAGVAASVGETARVTGDTALGVQARELFHRIAAVAGRENAESDWTRVNDVLSGKAGVGLSLLYAFEVFGDRRFLDAAVRAGDDLLQAAERLPDGGMRWMRGLDTPLDLPNFSHGTSGVGFFMARLASVTGAARFLEAALASVSYLNSIADTRDGLLLVPYGVPNDDYATPYDIGWAHGPPGSARLYYELYQMNGDAVMRQLVDASARTVVASGVPGPTTNPALWAGPFRIDRRFGTAGTASFLADWGNETGNTTYSDAAVRLVDDILDRATESADGLYWLVPRYGFQGPGADGAFTGYFYGSAGFGLTLLHQHYATRGRTPAIRLPDDPFPTSRGS